MGFVNGIRTQDEPLSTPMLKGWRGRGPAARQSHLVAYEPESALLADWEADVLKNEPLIQSYMGNSDWRRLRYPYLAVRRHGGEAQRGAQVPCGTWLQNRRCDDELRRPTFTTSPTHGA